MPQKLQPNTHLGYKEGRKRITLWLHFEENGVIGFSVNIKQASSSSSGGSGTISLSSGKQVSGRYDCQEYIDKALASN